MNNIDYFIKACQLGACYYTEWVFNVFCVSDLPTVKDHQHYPMRPYQKDGLACYHMQDIDPNADDDFAYILFNGKPMDITKDGPIVKVDEEIEITPQDIPSLKEASLKTTPGIFFFNYYCLLYGVGSMWPYEKGPNIKAAQVAKKMVPFIVDDPEEGSKVPEGKIPVKDFRKTLSAMVSFSGFCSINSPSATVYTMTGSEEVKKKKAELLKKHANELDNPVVVANIEKELVELDREYINSDPNKGFYLSDKGIANARKNAHGMQGLKFRMDKDKKPTLITSSLTDEVDPETLPAVYDGIRSASFFRGKMTALGGEAVKFIYRIYNASSIVKEDCGTTLGVEREITEGNMARYTGAYIVEKGLPVVLTTDNVKSYLGKKVIMRSPGFCRADPSGRGYCIKCIGESMRGYENSLASYGAGMSNDMMYRFMKAMHDDTSKTVKLLLDKAIT